MKSEIIEINRKLKEIDLNQKYEQMVGCAVSDEDGSPINDTLKCVSNNNTLRERDKKTRSLVHLFNHLNIVIESQNRVLSEMKQ